jgi:hypothetical protein
VRKLRLASGSAARAASTIPRNGRLARAAREAHATFDASSGTGTITRNAAWTVGTITFNAATGGLTLGNSGDTAAVNLNNLTANGSGTRTINLGASTWTCGQAGTVACSWGVTGATNLTWNPNTSTVVLSGSTTAAYQIFNPGPNGTTYNILTFGPDVAGNRGTNTNSGSITIGTLNIASPNTIPVNNTTWTVTTLNWTGGTPGFSSWSTLYSATQGSVLTIALTNPSTCSYCIFGQVTVTGSTITGTNAIDLGRLTGFSLTPPSGGGSGGGRIIGG